MLPIDRFVSVFTLIARVNQTFLKDEINDFLIRTGSTG